MVVYNPADISFEAVYNKLVEFIDNKPEVDSWLNRLDAGIGTTQLQLHAFLDVSLKRNNAATRKDIFATHSNNRSSVIAFSADKGYSAFRGQNLHEKITVTPNQSIGLEKFDSFGTAKGYSVILLKPYTLIKNQPIELEVVFGFLREQTVVAQSEEPGFFRFFNAVKVSNDTRYLLNGTTELPLAQFPQDMVNDAYYELTNAFESVDLLYFNNIEFTNRYVTGDEITLQYIERKDIESLTTLDLPSDIVTVYGTVTASETITKFIDVEPIASILANGILFNKANKSIQDRDGYKNKFAQLDPFFIDTEGRDISPADQELTYIKEVNDVITLLTPVEKDIYRGLLEVFRFFGNQPPPIIDSVQSLYNLSISARFYPNIPFDNLNDDIQEILDWSHGDNNINEDGRIGRRSKKLQYELDLAQLEHEVEKLPYIQVARVSINRETRQNSTPYARGKFVVPVTPNDLYFECVSPGITAASQPNMNVNAGEYVIENPVIWQPDTAYAIGQTVIPSTFMGFAYKVIQTSGGGQSGNSEPNFALTALYQQIFDNELIWVAVSPRELTSVVWLAYNLSDLKYKLFWNEYFIFDYGGIVTEI